MKRAFVVGATGYTGREVVRRLVEAGVKTTAHVRPDSEQKERWDGFFGGLGAEVDATPWEIEAQTETLSELAPDLVFGLLGTTRSRSREAAARGREETYETVDYALSSLLIRAAGSCDIPPRFVYLSAVGVAEGTTNRYYRARWRVESELRESGLPFTIVRPSFISGPGRDEARPLERAGAVALDAALSLVLMVGARSVAERYSSMTNLELATALVALALDPTKEGRIVEGGVLRQAAAGPG